MVSHGPSPTHTSWVGVSSGPEGLSFKKSSGASHLVGARKPAQGLQWRRSPCAQAGRHGHEDRPAGRGHAARALR